MAARLPPAEKPLTPNRFGSRFHSVDLHRPVRHAMIHAIRVRYPRTSTACFAAKCFASTAWFPSELGPRTTLSLSSL